MTSTTQPSMPGIGFNSYIEEFGTQGLTSGNEPSVCPIPTFAINRFQGLAISVGSRVTVSGADAFHHHTPT